MTAKIYNPLVTIRCLRAEADLTPALLIFDVLTLQSAASVRRQTNVNSGITATIKLQSAASVRRQTEIL